jgi:hypothetical protein
MPRTYRHHHRRSFIKQTGSGLQDDLYDGAASVGRVMAVVNLIGGVLLALILLGIGVYLLTSPQKYSASASASVTAAECTRVEIASDKGPVYTCAVTLVFNDKAGKEITAKTTVSQASPVVVGSRRTVRYDPLVPQDVSTNMLTRRMLGWIFTGVAVLVGLGSGLSFWIAQRSKVMAAVMGADAVQNAVFAAVRD